MRMPVAAIAAGLALAACGGSKHHGGSFDPADPLYSGTCDPGVYYVISGSATAPADTLACPNATSVANPTADAETCTWSCVRWFVPGTPAAGTTDPSWTCEPKQDVVMEFARLNGGWELVSVAATANAACP